MPYIAAYSVIDMHYMTTRWTCTHTCFLCVILTEEITFYQVTRVSNMILYVMRSWTVIQKNRKGLSVQNLLLLA